MSTFDGRQWGDTPLDPLAVDQELRGLVERWRHWRRELRSGAVNRTPFGSSERLGRELLQWALGLPEELPLRMPLARWIYRLAEQRIDAWWLAEEVVLVHHEKHPVREPREGSFSIHEMTRAALSDSAAAQWHAARRAAVTRLAAHRAELWQRRLEIARRWGFESPDALELPSATIYDEASRYLDETEEPVFDRVGTGWLSFVESSLARDAAEGWPARLAPDTLADLLGHRDWLYGVDLRPGPLPARLAPASFLRAFARLGAAWQVALASGRGPFVLFADPYGLAAWTHGALWASMVARAEFAKRRLGLARHRAADHERHLGLAVIQWSRLLAVRCSARPAVLQGGQAWRESSSELAFRLTRQELEPGLFAGLTRLRVDDPQRLAAWFLAADLHRRLVEQYDEDWFRAPRAVEQLREEAKLPISWRADPEALTRGRKLLERWLVEIVGR